MAAEDFPAGDMAAADIPTGNSLSGCPCEPCSMPIQLEELIVTKTHRYSTPEWGTKLCLLLCLLGWPAWVSPVLAASAAQITFPTPDAGVQALVEALARNDRAALLAILGPKGHALISSGDPVADRHSRDAFVSAYRNTHRLTLDGETQARLTIGTDEWPLPIPLQKTGGLWRFDTPHGEREILARRIGRNELSAIQVCLAIIDAQHDYIALHQEGDGVIEYAAQFVSTPGQHNGLFWPTTEEEPLSPLGPLLATATREGYSASASNTLAPYHGYFYRILTKQGPDAPGDARDYLVNGHMIGGFAVLAYPARYGVSGVMSFIVNQDGLLFEKDLGKKMNAIASAMTTFNPDSSWTPVTPEPAVP